MFYKSVVFWKYLVLVMICTSTASAICRPGAFPCANGRCIALLWRCDGLDDCGDHSDEENCVGQAALLYRSSTNVLMLDLETLEKTIIASGLGNIVAIDYDYARGVVLCTDTLNKSIYKIKLEDGTPSLNSTNNSNIESVVKDQLIESEGIAVDWIHGNVYWTDDGRKTISVATLDGRWIRLLFHKNITRPRSIVVNPLEGWFFWTDFGTPAKIERAGMDGSERSVIISKDIHWPNSLAIDFVTKRVLWVDVVRQTLSSSDYDGSDRRLILSLCSEDSYSFALDVFQDWLYWSDWSSDIIKKVNKLTGNNLTMAANETMSRTDLKVYHSHKQPKGINYCDNTCSHFCLPAPHVTEESTQFTCFCPDGMILGDDKKICVPDVCEIKEKVDTCLEKDMDCETDTTTNEGFKCVCKKGDEDNGDGTCKNVCEIKEKTCTERDMDCETDRTTNDGFKCVCKKGYKDNGDGTCKRNAALLFNHRKNILLLDLETHEKTIIVRESDRLAALDYDIDLYTIQAIDYDYARGVVVWSDTWLEEIRRISLQNRTSILNSPNGSNIDTVVKDKRIYSLGIAVDWIHGNVYWTDYKRDTISVATLDGSVVKVLISEFVFDSGDIVVNPLEGWLFWADSGRANPCKIKRAGMDGSERSVIISGDLGYAISLAIDYGTKKLLFLDAGENTLSSANYDGSNRRRILTSDNYYYSAYSLDVFEDWLYWRDNSFQNIQKTNKFTGKRFAVVGTETRFTSSLRVYHSNKQPKGINYCNNTNSTCSHFCLPAPHISEKSPKFTCFCPDGLVLGDDKKTCVTS